MLFLYLISQDEHVAYDTYDSAVVVAESSEAAQKIHPTPPGFLTYPDPYWEKDSKEAYRDWASDPSQVTVRLLGACSDPSLKAGDIVCASFNAG